MAEAPTQWRKSFEWILAAPLDKVWEITHDFMAMEKWVPSILRKSTLLEGKPQTAGCVRHVELVHSDPTSPQYANERLLEMDPENYRYKYRVEKFTAPAWAVIEGYVATFQLADAGNNSTRLLWSYEADPVPGVTAESFQGTVLSMYEAFVSDLKKVLMEC